MKILYSDVKHYERTPKPSIKDANTDVYAVHEAGHFVVETYLSERQPFQTSLYPDKHLGIMMPSSAAKDLFHLTSVSMAGYAAESLWKYGEHKPDEVGEFLTESSLDYENTLYVMKAATGIEHVTEDMLRYVLDCFNYAQAILLLYHDKLVNIANELDDKKDISYDRAFEICRTWLKNGGEPFIKPYKSLSQTEKKEFKAEVKKMLAVFRL
ncbi:MAG: hypothetical protein GX280_09430 [Lentisphaerae bacterium]|jgi:ATP-dependent Zn protease|nr:hypothetical protein [Lentisphaerota bacterium]